jgi:hypothetical protein
MGFILSLVITILRTRLLRVIRVCIVRWFGDKSIVEGTLVGVLNLVWCCLRGIKEVMHWLIESVGTDNVSGILILVDWIVVSLLRISTSTLFQFLWDFLTCLSEELD